MGSSQGLSPSVGARGSILVEPRAPWSDGEAVEEAWTMSGKSGQIGSGTDGPVSQLSLLGDSLRGSHGHVDLSIGWFGGSIENWLLQPGLISSLDMKWENSAGATYTLSLVGFQCRGCDRKFSSDLLSLDICDRMHGCGSDGMGDHSWFPMIHFVERGSISLSTSPKT